MISNKIAIINKAVDNEIFNQHIEEILGMFNSILDSLKVENVKIDVVIEEYQKDSLCGGFFLEKKKKYIISLNKEILTRYHEGNQYDLEVVILHELIHLIDRESIKKSENIYFDPSKRTDKNDVLFVMNLGYKFWTEFIAYRSCFLFYDKNYKYPSIKILSDKYGEMCKLNKEIMNDIKANNIDQDKLYLLGEKLRYFAYYMAEHLAGIVYGKRNYYKYCKKTCNKKEFKKIEKLEIGFAKKIQKFCSNTYGRYFEKRIYELGAYIMENIYIPFDIYLAKFKGKIKLVKEIDD